MSVPVQVFGVQPTVRQRRLRAALHGGLIGAWWGSFAVLLVRGADNAFWLTSLGPERLQRAIGFESAVLPMLAKRVGLPFAPLLSSLFLSCILVGLFAGYLTSASWDAWRIDPRRRVRAAIAAVLEQRALLLWLVAGPVVATVVLGVYAAELLAVPGLLAWLSAPFLLLDRGALSGSPPLRRFSLAWPGGQAFAAAVAVCLLAFGLGAAIEFLGSFGGVAGAVVGEAAIFGVEVIAGCLFCAAWIDRTAWSGLWVRARPWWRRETLLAFVAWQFYLMVALLWLLPPLLFLIVGNAWVIPQVQFMLEQEGDSLPEWIGILSHASSHAYVLALLCTPLVLAVEGRLYVSTVVSKPAA